MASVWYLEVLEHSLDPGSPAWFELSVGLSGVSADLTGVAGIETDEMIVGVLSSHDDVVRRIDLMKLSGGERVSYICLGMTHLRIRWSHGWS